VCKRVAKVTIGRALSRRRFSDRLSVIQLAFTTGATVMPACRTWLMLLSAIVIACLPTTARGADTSRRPNILFIFSDDLEYRHDDKWLDEEKWRILPKLFPFSALSKSPAIGGN
jgi:hypothetical protein